MTDVPRRFDLAAGLLLALSVTPRVTYAQSEAPHDSHEHASTEHSAASESAAPEGHVEHGDHVEEVEHEPVQRFHVGLVGTLIGRITPDGTELQRGGGFIFAWHAVPEHFEIEAVAHAVMVPEGYELPIDLLAVVPIPVSRYVEPYIGVGGTIIPYAVGERSGFLYGIATAAGVHIRITTAASLLVEFNYNAIWGDPQGAFFHELGGSIGPVVAF